MDHHEHLQWCRERAREYLAAGDHMNAVTSMMSDLQKHDDWRDGKLCTTMMMLYMVDPTRETAERIVEGFR